MLQRKHPGVGWVRGDLIPSQDASLEILDLRKQIESLEKKLEDARTRAPTGTENLAQGEDIVTVHYSCYSQDKKYSSYTWNPVIETTWDAIFYQVSPLMINKASDLELRQALNKYLEEDGGVVLSAHEDAKGHKFSHFVINEDDFQTIKVQLRALGLIAKSEKGRSVKDTLTYWTLTPYGDSVMNRLRAIEKDDG